MTTKPAVKFTFDTRFDDGTESALKASARAASSFTEEDLARARAEGHASGFIEGEAKARAESESEMAHAMEHFAANAGSLLAALQAESAVIRGEAATLALVAIRKLAPALIATRPQAEIEAVLRDCLTHLNREPHIVLRVSEAMVEQLKTVVDHMAMERGLSGRIILLGQNDIAEGDCIVEWADGGVIRSRAEIENELNEIVERYITTLTTPKADLNRLALPEAR
ncbi:MAG: FliH/SctL family protein [Parvibaculum sp.]|nr:FliH/SctL family protein [Parvibaculum sp.]